MSSKTPEAALIDTLVSAEIQELTCKFAEVGVDSLMQSSVFRDLPIIRSILGLYRIGKDIRQHLFVQKVCRFVAEINKTSFRERRDFVRELGDEKAQLEFGQNV